MALEEGQQPAGEPGPVAGQGAEKKTKQKEDGGGGGGGGGEEEANYVLRADQELGTDLSGYLDFDPARYEAQLQAKVATLLPRFARFMAPNAPPPEVFRSPPRHHRLRIKLGIGVLPPPAAAADAADAADAAAAADARGGQLTYLMWDPEGRPVPVSDFPIASRRINALMPRLLAALESGPEVLRRGLRAVAFLDTLARDALLVTLMYKVPIIIDDGSPTAAAAPSWAEAARTWLKDGLQIEVVGRSRGVVVPVDRGFVVEALDISRPPPEEDGQEDQEGQQEQPGQQQEQQPGQQPQGPVLRYKQVEGAFSNPNGHMAIHTLRWLCARADAILHRHGATAPGPETTTSKAPRDLLELYCGNGNHTMALARRFRRVVGVEINARLVAVARENLALNGIEEGAEAVIVQIPAEKFRPSRLASYWRQQQQQTQQKQEGGKGEGDQPPPFDFASVLVDPPRVGLDRYTRKLVSHHDHVLYISCGPWSLLRDLQGEGPDPEAAAAASPEGRKHLALAGFGLGSTHEIVAMAVLDHFPYTTHVEVAVHLRRRQEE